MKVRGLVVLALAAAASGAAGAAPVKPVDFVRIEIGEGDEPWTGSKGGKSHDVNDELQKLREQNRKLKRRVRGLEQAVRQLQDTVYGGNLNAVQAPGEKWVCSVLSAYLGTASTKVEATTIALNACRQNNGFPFDCVPKKVECERATASSAE